ncbi:MAG: DUF1501 domain-containing protein [Verrucomicrobia bacterium]|nr:DUF1501 domain-containing protein [Verrucomicrobiota bacterium]
MTAFSNEVSLRSTPVAVVLLFTPPETSGCDVENSVINANGGRDHHPRVFSTMFAGGGITGGQVYGSSDDKGIAVKENPVEAKDFNATIAYAMGLDLNKVIYAPSGRPFLVAGHTRDPKTDQIVTEGHPLMPLFS